MAKVQTLRDLQVAFQKHTGERDYSAVDGVSQEFAIKLLEKKSLKLRLHQQPTPTCMGGASNALTYGVGATSMLAWSTLDLHSSRFQNRFALNWLEN